MLPHSNLRNEDRQGEAMEPERPLALDLPAVRNWTVSCDRAGHVLWSNRPEIVPGDNVRDRLGPAVSNLVADDREPDGTVVLVRHPRPDDGDRWFSWQIVPTHDDRRLLVGRDVTEEQIDRRVSAAERTILRRLVDGQPLSALIGIACHAFESLVEGAICSVMLVDHARGCMYPGGGDSLPEPFRNAVHGIAIGPLSGTCGRAIATGEEAVTEDVSQDPAWGPYAALALGNGLRACWSQPLRGPNVVLGTFAVYRRRPHRPTDREREVAQRLAGVVTAAIQHRAAEEAARRSLERAEAADHAKSAFLAQVSHELRTPLNAVIGFADVMEQGLWGPLGDPRYREYAASIRQAGGHLVTLVNQILDLSTAEAGGRRLRQEPVPLGDLVREAWTLASNARPAADVPMIMAPEIADVRLLADPDALRQMLVNLLGNAVKFTPNRHVIRVEFRRTEEDLRVTVRDEGRGMDSATLDRLRAGDLPTPSASVATGQGAGLGLRITRLLAELHGGRLEFDADPGGGSAVSIVLPAWREDGA
jgi:signal transduction histidine kinase